VTPPAPPFFFFGLGYQVTIFEAGPNFGGKAGCDEYNENLIRDHSIKNFSSYYYCLLETMKRIPYEDPSDPSSPQGPSASSSKRGKKAPLKTVFDNLRSYDNLKCVFPDGSIIDIDTSLDKSTLESLSDFAELRKKLRKEGVPPRKIDSYVWKHIKSFSLPCFSVQI